MPSDEPAVRGPRRDTLETVFTAAFRLLIAEGAGAITAHRIHQETGIARTTIYRHWPQPHDLLSAMLERATGEHNVAAFRGELEHDLQSAVDSLVFRFNERPVRPLFGALVALGRDDPTCADIADGYVDGLLSPLYRAIDEATDRGDITTGDRLAFVTEISGPLFMRHVLLGGTVTETDGRAVVRDFIDRHGTGSRPA